MEKIAIYGVGAFGKLFYQALNKEIDFFIDDHSLDEEYDGKVIKKVENISLDTKVLISVLQYSSEIELKLLSKGFTNIVNFNKTIKQIPNIFEYISKLDYLWLVEDRKRMINESELLKFRELLKDTKSKELLSNIISFRKTLDPKFYIEPKDIEYFPSDVPILDNIEILRFIDCGAYTGDTIEYLVKQNKEIDFTISFEPDCNNLISLQKQLSLLKKSYKNTNFLVYPAGVYSKNDVLKFANNGIASSASINEDSTIEVPVVALDSVILNSNVNYIKMDIEGAEKEAIIGAKETIKKYRPNLAICLYHKPEDLWELPLLINEIEPSYDMYLRVHEDLCLSTVLYCIPKE